MRPQEPGAAGHHGCGHAASSLDWMSVSANAARAESCRGRAPLYLEIGPQRPGLEVADVKIHHLLEPQIASNTHLPQPDDAGLHHVSALVRFLELAAPQRQRPRAHQAHVACHHAEKLRHLLQAKAARHSVDASDPRAVANLTEHAAGLATLRTPRVRRRKCTLRTCARGSNGRCGRISPLSATSLIVTNGLLPFRTYASVYQRRCNRAKAQCVRSRGFCVVARSGPRRRTSEGRLSSSLWLAFGSLPG